MGTYVLNPEGVPVVLTAQASDVLVQVGALAFCCSIRDLVELQHGITLQYSADSEFCRFEAKKDGLRVDYASRGAKRTTFLIPLDKLGEAIVGLTALLSTLP